ncbi:uncharacterized protein V3H82_024172 [Fundulus diaphanus]
MVVGVGGFSTLTRRNGIKVGAGSPCSVEEVCLAVGEVIGHRSIKSAARMNGAVVLFVEKIEQAQQLVEAGISVNGLFLQVSPLTLPATKIMLSNVPPFISDDFLVRELSRHGKVVSPIKKVLSGCKSPLLKHVVSHRRQLYMILNRKDEELNVRFHVKLDDFEYVLFATSSNLKCFGCGQEGHIIRMCPNRAGPAPPQTEERCTSAAAQVESVVAEVPAADAEEPPEVAGVSTAAEGQPLTADVVGVTEGCLRDVVEEPGVNGEKTLIAGCVGIDGCTAVCSGGGDQITVGGGVEEGGEQSAEQRGEADDEEHLASGDRARKQDVQEEDGGAEAESGGTLLRADLEERRGEAEELMEQEASAMVKRRSKRKNVVAVEQASKQSSKMVADRKEQLDSSDSEEEFSDSSEVSLSQVGGNESRYSVESFLSFIQQTKGLRGLKVESYFPNLKLFYASARYYVRKQEESGLTDQEIFRLKKIMGKVRKQL